MEVDMITLLVKCGAAKSKREAKQLINEGAIKINGTKVDHESITIKIPDQTISNMKEEKQVIKDYFATGDRTEIDKRGIKFVQPL